MARVRIVIDPKFKIGVRAMTRDTAGDVGKAVVTHAKLIVPVDTALLQSKIGSRVMSYKLVKISAKTHYAVYVERGTHNEDGTVRMRAQPYLRPAIASVSVSRGGVL